MQICGATSDLLLIEVDFFGDFEYDEFDSSSLMEPDTHQLTYELAETVLEGKIRTCEYWMQALDLIGTDYENGQKIESRKILVEHIFKCKIDDEEWKQALMMAKLSDSAQALLDYCVNSSEYA